MTPTDDDAMDAALARGLAAGADDTAPLSRAVLTRLTEPAPAGRANLAEVLVQPLPAGGLMLGLLLLAAALGYALTPAEPDEIAALVHLLGLGF